MLYSWHGYSLSRVFSSPCLSSYVTVRFSQLAFRPSKYGTIRSKFFLVDKKSDLTAFNPTPKNLETKKTLAFQKHKKSEFALKEKKLLLCTSIAFY